MSDSILVLDDELGYAEMLRDLLGEKGFRAEVATDPKEALERLHETSYALIVTDFKMPEVDGAQFLVEARRIIPKLPVIMVSGLMTTPDLLKVANIGVTLVLEKPFNVDVFMEYVRRFATPEHEEQEIPAGETGVPAAGVEGDGNYPAELRYLVDDSEASHNFVRELWGHHVNGFKHLMLQLPSGAEFSDVVKEVGAWNGSPGLASFHFSLLELDSPTVRDSIRELASADFSSPSIAITLPDGARFDPKLVADFVRWVEGEEPASKRFSFVYGVPFNVDVQPLYEQEDLVATVASPVRMAPLKDRLVDLAAYMGRFLAAIPREAQCSLDPEAATALLQYDWPGNHRELMSVLRRAFNMAADGVVGRDQVEAAIRSKHGEMTGEGMKLNLESFLLVEQRRFLDTHTASGQDLQSLSEVAGVAPERLRTDKSAAEQPLLFPELLEDEDPGKRSE